MTFIILRLIDHTRGDYVDTLKNRGAYFYAVDLAQRKFPPSPVSLYAKTFACQ